MNLFRLQHYSASLVQSRHALGSPFFDGDELGERDFDAKSRA
jgi:hypothetical protein